MIKHVLVDLGGVLVRSSSKPLRDLLRRTRSPPGFMDRYLSYRDSILTGRLSMRRMVESLNAEFATSFSVQTILGAKNSDTQIDRMAFERLRTLARALEGRIHFHLCTDIGRGDLLWLRSHVPLDAFESIIASCETAKLKSDPGFFGWLSQCLSFAPEETLLLDDNRQNLDLAREAGLETVQYHGPQSLDLLEAILPASSGTRERPASRYGLVGHRHAKQPQSSCRRSPSCEPPGSPSPRRPARDQLQ